MSKNIKRLFLVVIIACLSVFAFSSCSGDGGDKPLGEPTPTPVATEEPAPQEGRIKKVSKKGKCGDRLNWEYGDDNALVIYGTGEMQNYGTEEGALPQWVYLDIKRIDVLDGATSIGDFAFYGMENVSEIKVAKSVTKSGYDAFEGTGWLNNKEDSFVVLGDGVLVKYKGASPQVTIPHGVKYISNAFDEYGDDGLDISSVKMTDSVKEIGSHAFYGCRFLYEVVFSNSLHTIGESAFENSGIRNTITLPSSVVSIENRAFAMCKGLYKINLSESLEKIGDFAFADSGISRFEIPKNVKEIGNNPFLHCSDLRSITVSEENENFASDENGVLYNKNMNLIVVCPDGKRGEFIIEDSVKEIKEYAFFGCDLMESVYVPDSVTRIGDFAFSNSITICGRANSQAHRYAQNNGYAFEKMDAKILEETKE